jgi:hypothetical protein
MQNSTAGGIKYTQLYHAIGLIRPCPEREEKDGKIDAGCIQLLMQLALRAEQDGTGIHVDAAKLAASCFCQRWEIYGRLNVLRTYGYILKSVDEQGQPRKHKRHFIYELSLPGVHYLIGEDGSKINRSFLSQFEDESEQTSESKGNTSQKGSTAAQLKEMTEEEYYEKQTEMIDLIMQALRSGREPRRLQGIAHDWNIDLSSCVEAAKEQHIT